MPRGDARLDGQARPRVSRVSLCRYACLSVPLSLSPFVQGHVSVKGVPWDGCAVPAKNQADGSRGRNATPRGPVARCFRAADESRARVTSHRRGGCVVFWACGPVAVDWAPQAACLARRQPSRFTFTVAATSTLTDAVPLGIASVARPPALLRPAPPPPRALQTRPSMRTLPAVQPRPAPMTKPS